MQAKDIPEEPVLRFLDTLRWPDGMKRWGTMYEGYDNSVLNAMPPETPAKVGRAKMTALIRRGLVTGCTCGCRGDFELTAKGRERIRA